MCICVSHVWAPMEVRIDEGIGSPGDEFNRLLWAVWYSCWKLNPGPLEKPQKLLTTNPSLQHQPLTVSSVICLLLFFSCEYEIIGSQ